MGCNFYLRGHASSDDPDLHIGKRSAAGKYCWDCQITLCKEGEAGVHCTRPWHKACPKCGKKPEDEGWNGSGGRELGFNKLPPGKKTGVKSCSSFSWAMSRQTLMEKVETWDKTCHVCTQTVPDPEKVIQNEYGGLFTLEEFLAVLEECPIQYMDSIGTHFS